MHYVAELKGLKRLSLAGTGTTDVNVKDLRQLVNLRELDLTGAAAVVFRHAGHGRVNLVYRRADGHIGWIDPPALSAASAH